MKSDFETSPRMLAFPVSELAKIQQHNANYGATLPLAPKLENSPLVRCLAGGKDREDSDDLRGLAFGKTASTTILSDGRHAFSGYWTKAVIAAVQAGTINATEITEAEYHSLLPEPSE